MKFIFSTAAILTALTSLTGCSTVVAAADAAGSAAIYAGKTAINAIDTVTPDIVNKD